MTVPAYLPYYVMAGSVGAVASLLFGLSRTLKHADWPQSERDQTLWISGAVLVGWFALAIILAGLNVYQADPHRLPTIQYGIAVPIVIGGLVLWRSSTVSRLIDLVPQHGLVAVQLYRALAGPPMGATSHLSGSDRPTSSAQTGHAHKVLKGKRARSIVRTTGR